MLKRNEKARDGKREALRANRPSPATSRRWTTGRGSDTGALQRRSTQLQTATEEGGATENTLSRPAAHLRRCFYFHADRCINAAPRPGQVQVADLVAQLRRDNTAYPPDSTALEVPSTRPERSLARAATYGSVLRTTMAVSNPSRGIDPNDFNLRGFGPTSTSQLATSVAPFQLA